MIVVTAIALLSGTYGVDRTPLVMVTADEVTALKRRAVAQRVPPSILAYQLLAPALRRAQRAVQQER